MATYLTWRDLREVTFGTMLVFPEQWDIFPYCIVPAGTKAIVTVNGLANKDDGCLYVITDSAKVTEALQEWQGCVQFNPMNDGYGWGDEFPVALPDEKEVPHDV